MSVTYSIDPSERVVYLKTESDPSFDEWRDALLSVFSDPSFQTGFDFVSDRRRAPAPDTRFAELQIGFVREHAREIGRCRWAAVVKDPATYGMARMVTTRADMRDVEVEFFYDLDEARRWLLARRR